MGEIWGIEGASYDGCNGWSTWMCSVYFSTKEKAEEYIKERWGHGGVNRFEPIRIKVE